MLCKYELITGKNSTDKVHAKLSWDLSGVLSISLPVNQALSSLPAHGQRQGRQRRESLGTRLLTGEDIDDVIFHSYCCLCKQSIYLFCEKQLTKWLENNNFIFS